MSFSASSAKAQPQPTWLRPFCSKLQRLRALSYRGAAFSTDSSQLKLETQRTCNGLEFWYVDSANVCGPVVSGDSCGYGTRSPRSPPELARARTVDPVPGVSAIAIFVCARRVSW